MITRVVLDGGGFPLSGMLATPEGRRWHSLIVALHGSGMRAGYFDCRSRSGQSLLELAAELGWAVLALDRPGYGDSAEQLPEGQHLPDQAVALRTALGDFAERYSAQEERIFLLGHSFGGKLALTAAAECAWEGRLFGVAVSGCGHRYAVSPEELATIGGNENWWMNWGKLRLYPPGAFRLSEAVVAPVPSREVEEALAWQERFPRLAPAIRTSVRFTFAEHERWWLHEERAVRDLPEMLSSAHVTVDRQPHAGHNISLGCAARSYHLRVLSFFEECLLEREMVGEVSA
ncbi:alpha/beta hydrolase family protein [Actinopolyspora mortivallis]|uniref:Alpha/beta hydrolase n=1 Tax=Actinopolyspora mortivallis TaxID=33906 RepID=A0A2T0GYN3_ACTMO|nr:alpha/beta fold hydrolase [Actinopolyspora mortivallis]PRW64219.1 alpha/beta hydrolase [Actinopolyspora mortivallis]